MDIVGRDDCYDVAPEELLPLQIEAANERLESQVQTIGLLKNRVESSQAREVKQPADLVPLLFAHTAYKSYSENWLTEGQWDRMTRWLNAVAARPVEGVDFAGVETLDGWIKQMESVGHYLSCSSGTTGKPAIMSGTESDIDFSARANAAGIVWGLELEPSEDRKFFGIGPQFAAPRENAIKDAMIATIAPHVEAFQFGSEPITVGSMVEMIVLRRKIADGTARPSELAEFEKMAAQRGGDMAASTEKAVDALIEARNRPIMVSGMYGQLFPIAEAVRAKGYSGKDFHPGNAMFVAGGLKGLVLPEDYREYILETFNVPEHRMYHTYSMREINATFPLCHEGRYHISPWVIILPLDVSGEQWLDPGNGEIEARAAFMDLSIEGHWGGIITGDKVSVSFGKCRCGHQGPTVARDILRFADLPDGDKISCAGSIDAYVRGVS
ncbi:hypothetical protein AWC00_20245 [Mycobacterium conspicuum]|nr:hypothetical protein AWC00_20245 [Mycobacterium conspicuum]